MTSFIAIYRGKTIADARLIAVSTDTDLVSEVSTRLLQQQHSQNEDPVIESLETGRRSALRIIRQESTQESESKM